MSVCNKALKYPAVGFLIIILLHACTEKSSEQYDKWEEYLGGPGRNHYSSLTQINPANVKDLKVAWTYSAPDSGQMQMTPIIVDGILYGVTATVQAFALDAATGKEIWRFGDTLRAWHSTSRGVAYWSDGKDKRILYTIGPNLVALDALTGKLIESFGEKGKVDLHTGLPASAKNKFIISNTPGTVFEDMIIMPVRVAEDEHAAPGDIRAFNVRTGKLVWSFHTIPYPGEPGYDTWPEDAYKNSEIGGANNWAGMAVDRNAGILFVPTGSAAPDFFGGHRKGANLYANCLLALEAKTGKLIWHYQFAHHDLLDRDMPCPPNLLRVKQNGKTIDAVAQVTKQGYVFVFDRKTGKPLFPIEEIKAPASGLAGESAWETQPVPTLPRPFARQANELTENDISPYAENKEELLNIFRLSDKKLFAPPSVEGTFLLPGYDGGAEWGGAAADPDSGILYVNSNEMAWILKMSVVTGASPGNSLSPGENLYTSYCSGCHGKDLSGNVQSGYPSLLNIAQKKSKDDIDKLVISGKGMMPGMPHIPEEQRKAITAFLFNEEKKEVISSVAINSKPVLPYKHAGYTKFLDSKGLPAISPPWGTLNAIDLNTGEYLWKIPFGETPSLQQQGFPQTGSESYGGPVVTASGLLFIAATKDGKFRAFDKRTGKLLWETQLPVPAFATPATYEVNGKQYIVMACGGGKLGAPKGDKIIAFALE
ncbi:MAG TPA: pyrroloquinoline quinone-dependent dehydrogenase [Chitinophagaceae bacterium]